VNNQLRFKFPPVKRVIQTIWFEQLETLRTLDLADIRTKWFDEFPVLEEVPPLPAWANVSTNFALVGSDGRWPMPACVFASVQRDRQVLVQQDRLHLGWRFDPDTSSDYPGFATLSQSLSRYFEDFTYSIRKASNPRPNVERVEIVYVNQLVGIDAEDVGRAILVDETIAPTISGRQADSIIVSKHFCGTDENMDVTLQVSVREGPSDVNDDEHAHSSRGSQLEIVGFADVEPEMSYEVRLDDVHSAILHRFLLLVGDDLRNSWGEYHGQG